MVAQPSAAAKPAPLRAYFLVGPTAVGKSAVAEWIAAREGWALLSADALLAYRGMDLGTAKPDAATRQRLTYHGLDLVEADECFDVAAYRRHALAVLRNEQAAGRPVVVVGGSGLYVRALVDGLAEAAPGASPRRAEWEALLAAGGPAALRSLLTEQAPAMLAALSDPANPRRLMRALEWVAAGLRTPPADWRARDAVTRPPMAGLRRAPDDLKARIGRRARDMFARGLVEEWRALPARTAGRVSPTARAAIGYAEADAVLTGACAEAEAVARTSARTWQLARRQMTWFRHQVAVHWIDAAPDAGDAALAAAVMAHWREYGPIAIAE